MKLCKTLYSIFLIHLPNEQNSTSYCSENGRFFDTFIGHFENILGWDMKLCKRFTLFLRQVNEQNSTSYCSEDGCYFDIFCWTLWKYKFCSCTIYPSTIFESNRFTPLFMGCIVRLVGSWSKECQWEYFRVR